MEADCYRCDTKIRVFCRADLVHWERKKRRKEREETHAKGREMTTSGARIMCAEWMYIFSRDYCRFSAATRTILARARADKWHPWLSIGAKTARFVSVTYARAPACIENAVSPEKRSSWKLFPRRAINCCRMSGKFMRQEKEAAKKMSLERI